MKSNFLTVLAMWERSSSLAFRAMQYGLRFLLPSNTRRHLLETANEIFRLTNQKIEMKNLQTTDMGLTTLGLSLTLRMHPIFSSLASSASTKSGRSLADRLLGSKDGGGSESNSSL